jgi:hypothetical protein
MSNTSHAVARTVFAGAIVFACAVVCEPVTSHSSAVSAEKLCSSALPEETRRVLATKFPDWVIQSSATLSPSAEQRWMSEKPAACPGIAIGLFESDSTSSVAVLIVHAVNQDSSAKLLIFQRETVGHSADFKVLEDTHTEANNFFIRAAPAHRFFDKKAVKRFGVRAPEAILLFDAGKDEYETDIYFWTGSDYRHQPVDY